MISSLLAKLHSSKNWAEDDEPQLWEGIVEDPHQFATWDEVEYCLNNPQFYSITFINKDEVRFVELPEYERCWSRSTADVEEIMKNWEYGHNLIINNFDQGFRKKQEIIEQFERYFDGKTAFHVYAGLMKCNSFNAHEDTASNFILQVEGETHWKCYRNRCSNLVKKQPQKKEEFDFYQDIVPEPEKLECVIDHVLKPGDMLYIPARGYHQAFPSGKRLSVSIPMQHMLPHLKPIDRKYYDLSH